MLVVLPGHVRGQIVLGPDTCCSTETKTDAESSCCSAEKKHTKHTETPSQERKDRCAVCYQAHGYTVPPVYDFDFLPTGLCELRRLIEPSKRHQLLCDPVYFANGPPAALA